MEIPRRALLHRQDPQQSKRTDGDHELNDAAPMAWFAIASQNAEPIARADRTSRSFCAFQR